MSLKNLFEKAIYEYPKASKDKFKGHLFAHYFRNELPKSIQTILNLSEIYSVKASAGNGAWAKIPWIAIFNTLVTETVTSGFYCVYLFPADFSGIYLSLNQGFADKRNKYGISVAKNMISDKAKVFQNFLGEKIPKDFLYSLDLKLDCISKKTTTRRLGLAYQAGNIISKFYPADNIPHDNILLNDVQQLLEIYFILFEQFHLIQNTSENNEEEDNEWFEDLTRYKMHKVTERNYNLSKKVKQLLGYTCKACNFNFEDKYGVIGKEFIEAHHLIPISNLERKKIKLDPKQDFTVLCSNCHRMIHKINPIPSLEEFKKLIQ